MYKLSVGAIFKNESHGMKEWLDHYLYHGADHFYLVNDNSSDDFLPILQPYLDKQQVTLFDGQFPYYLGRQRDMYNAFILPHLKETKWLLMVDMDEYVWSPKCVNLLDLLNLCTRLGQIQIFDMLFGSNGHIEQPQSIVASFTKRQAEPRKFMKYFVNSDFDFSSLNIHHATFADQKLENINYFQMLDQEDFIVNHYSCQSREFWNNVKCTRGDGDHYLVRTLEDFDKVDLNDVDDTRLYDQNKLIVT
jgi:hypothetical protein